MRGRLPSWLKQQRFTPEAVASVAKLLDGLSLHTVCESANCPNMGDCFSRKTATFMILGDVCTRHCTFCAVNKGSPLPVDDKEPEHLLKAVVALNLGYIVITSVTRDDLADGGAAQFVKVIELLHKERLGSRVEVLIPDFQGSAEALRVIVATCPEVINHNVETVPRLYSEVRPEADYQRSLELLSRVKGLNPRIATKSGLMLGLGETRDEVIVVMADLRKVNCDLLTIGQYLPPSPKHHRLSRYVSPEEFTELRDIGMDMGFSGIASAPLVRSSFNAGELYTKAAARF